MTKSPESPTQLQRGFTLLEVMLVIVLIGIMVSAVQFGFGSNKQEELLQQASLKFAGVFEVATEYSMLNNVEMGIVIDAASYRFVGYDGTQWTDIPNQKIFRDAKLPPGVELELELEGLPIEEPQLFDSSVFNTEDEDEFDPSEEKRIIPQIYILSGGDMTPFSLTFRLNEDIALPEDMTYRVTGLYTIPLTIEGPIFDE